MVPGAFRGRHGGGSPGQPTEFQRLRRTSATLVSDEASAWGFCSTVQLFTEGSHMLAKVTLSSSTGDVGTVVEGTPTLEKADSAMRGGNQAEPSGRTQRGKIETCIEFTGTS